MAQPNILLISTDQQRYDTAPPHRPSFLRTPHFDDLSRKGFAFTQARTTCPVCVPARCTIMSGQHEWTHGRTANGPTADILDDTRTLPARLSALGYQSMAIGKMHFGPQRSRHGFDDCLIAADYFADLERRGITEHEYMHGLGQNEWHPGRASVSEPFTYTNWIAQRCVDFLAERRDPNRPFFLWCSFGKPHPPYAPPAPYDTMYAHAPIADPAVGDWAADSERCPRLVRDMQLNQNSDRMPADLVRDMRVAYDGLVTQIDYNLGRVFAALQDQGLLAETFIVFTSDHGDWLGDHLLTGKGRWLDGCTRVPMLIKPPASWGWQNQGEARDELVCLADLLPTLVGAAGGSAEDVDGMDLLELVRGQVSPRPYLEGIGGGGESRSSTERAITDGRWKYLWFPEGPTELLFDLEHDPHETRNLAGSAGHKAIQQQLREALDERLRRHAITEDAEGLVTHAPQTPTPDPQQRAKHWVGYHTEHDVKDVFH
jgi:arylsulfatase A-like enzyme